MEMEGTDPLLKKRKSEVSCSKEPKGISSLAPHEPVAGTDAPESGIQEPPPGAGAAEEEGVDWISGLPDAILGDIISLLPIREGARTQILASRWRHLWRSAPLNLDHDDLPAEGDVLVGLISKILSAHAGSGRRLRIPAHHLDHHPATVDAWLRSGALSNLQELEFCDAYCYPPLLLLPPASTFSFSSSLRVFAISQCRFPDGITDTLHFPHVNELTLEDVSISEGSLHSMIAACPVLQSMFLNGSTGYSCIRINSRRLRNIGVRVSFLELPLEKIVIVDAPCLERLIIPDLLAKGLDISIVSAPNLSTMGCLSYHHLGSSSFERSHAVFPTVVHTVKTLYVFVYAHNVDMAIDFVRCFPCLEKLYIRSNKMGGVGSNAWRHKHRRIRCLDISLKTIVLTTYRGTISDVNFAMFFVLNAKILELFRFGVKGRCSKKIIARQHKLLQLENRASKGARFDFIQDRCCRHLEDIKHVRDLSVADPFEC